MVIKVPVNMEGVKAASKLHAQGIRICLTACYASHQALVAGSAGVEYIAPYLGRMTDSGKDGMMEIERMQAIVEGLGCDTSKLRLCLEPSALILLCVATAHSQVASLHRTLPLHRGAGRVHPGRGLDGDAGCVRVRHLHLQPCCGAPALRRAAHGRCGCGLRASRRRWQQTVTNRAKS